MQLGHVTITGNKSLEIDGLFMGYIKRTFRFKMTTEGLIRNHKLYKTLDPAYLAESLGFIDYKYSISLTYNKGG